MFKGQEILIIKFKVQTSMFKGQEVLIIKFKVQNSMFKGQEVLIIKFKPQCSKVSVYTFGGVLRSCSVRKPQR